MKRVSQLLPAVLLMLALLPETGWAQGTPEQQQQMQMKMQMQGQIEQIARERPPLAEMGAREFLRRINRVTELDSSDIESVEVVKGTAAQAYGPKASNGVVLITTKSGKVPGRVVRLPRGASLAGS